MDGQAVIIVFGESRLGVGLIMVSPRSIEQLQNSQL